MYDMTMSAPERADQRRKVHALHKQGVGLRAIAEECRLGQRAIMDILAKRPPMPANDNVVVALVANNGGCSTLSGKVPVTLPRVRAMEEAA